MNLEAALTMFEIDGVHRKFTSSDRIKIKEVALELGLENQDFAINKFDSNFDKLPQEYKTYALELRNKNLFGSSGYWRFTKLR